MCEEVPKEGLEHSTKVPYSGFMTTLRTLSAPSYPLNLKNRILHKNNLKLILYKYMVHTATQPKIVSITYGEENHKGGILCNHKKKTNHGSSKTTNQLWSYSVAVSTGDFESPNPSSNLGKT